MKRNNIKKYFNLFVVCVFSFFIAYTNSNAYYIHTDYNIMTTNNNNVIALASSVAPSIKSVDVVGNSDVIHVVVSQGSSAIAGYYVGTDIRNSQYYQTNATDVYFSAMNGKQNVWVKDKAGKIAGPASVTITNSCTNQANVKNATGQGQVEKCFVFAQNSYKPVDGGGEIVTCADGYTLQYFNRSNYCSSVNNQSLSKYGLTHQYCSNVFHYNCVKDQVPAYLSNLTISSGTLSPAFKASTYTYSASVNVSTITVNASLNSDGSSFVEGYGSRTVNLNYGINTIYVKVQSKTGNITTYTLKITRIDNRSKDNNLSSLGVSVGSLSPSFSSATTSYTVNVEHNVTSIAVSATLSDAKASFVSGYGPRNVDLVEGNNAIAIKVKSQSGATKTYTVNVNRISNTQQTTPNIDTNELALLKSLELSEGNISFDPHTYEYTVYVNYGVTQVIATAQPQNSADKVTISGGDNLEVGIESQIVINVEDTSNNYSRVYTVNVIRKEENNDVSSNSEVSDITIKGHKINFEQSKETYNIILNKNEDELDITVTPEDAKSTVTIDGNKDLKMGSEITITVTAEDGSVTSYLLVIDGVKEGTNVFLVIILILLIIVVIGYIILRLLGYKVYFNFSLIGSFFRTIAEKIKNIFDR